MTQENIDVLKNTSKSNSEEVPYDSVPIPSKGAIYDEDHPLYQEERVDYKAMTAVEEDILTSKALIKKGTVVDELLRSCLRNKSIDPKSLLAGDKSAILLAIRISGFGEEYKVETTCPAKDCGESFSYSFNLSKCEVKPLGEDPVQPGKNLFEMVLPMSKKKVQFRLLTSQDEEEITQLQESRKKAIMKQLGGKAPDRETNVTDRLTYAIVSLDGERDKSKIAQKVKTLRAGDSKAIRKKMNEIEPDVRMEEEVSCPHCGAVETHDIPMGVEFLWPQ